MTIQTIIDSKLFHTDVSGEDTREISKVFCCDLLSIAMAKAPHNSIWVTVMANQNTLAVASLSEVSAIVLAEGVAFTENELLRASEEGIAVFSTELPVFDAALEIQRLLLP